MPRHYPAWDRDGAVQREATAKRIDWEGGGSVHNWKRHVGSNVRGVWHTLTNPQKIAVALDANERAAEEEWD